MPLRYCSLLPLLIGVLPSVLVAQEGRSLAAPPALPFGLTWTMTEREALAALKRAGVAGEIVERGNVYTEQEIRALCAEHGERRPHLAQRLRDEKTFRVYGAKGVFADSLLPATQFKVEFLRDRILKVWISVRTESDSQHFALAHKLDSRYRALYGGYAVGGAGEMPEFPEGRQVFFWIDHRLPEHPRPEVYYGWSGVMGSNIYGTSIFTHYVDPEKQQEQELVLLQQIGSLSVPDASTSTRRSR